MRALSANQIRTITKKERTPRLCGQLSACHGRMRLNEALTGSCLGCPYPATCPPQVLSCMSTFSDVWLPCAVVEHGALSGLSVCQQARADACCGMVELAPIHPTSTYSQLKCQQLSGFCSQQLSTATAAAAVGDQRALLNTTAGAACHLQPSRQRPKHAGLQRSRGSALGAGQPAAAATRWLAAGAPP